MKKMTTEERLTRLVETVDGICRAAEALLCEIDPAGEYANLLRPEGPPLLVDLWRARNGWCRRRGSGGASADFTGAGDLLAGLAALFLLSPVDGYPVLRSVAPLRELLCEYARLRVVQP